MRLSEEEVLAATRRACERAVPRVRQELRRRINRLATVAVTAPLFGILGTVIGIPSAFRGCGGDKSTCLAALVAGLSEAICPAATGLAIGVIAFWLRAALTNRSEALALEAQSMADVLIGWLRERRA